MKQNLGIYCPTLRGEQSNPWKLNLVLGNTPQILQYQKRVRSNPSFYYAQGDRTCRAYSFSQIKSMVEPMINPQAQENLQRWREQVGEEEADRICKESIDAGNMGHKALANWVQDQPLGVCSMNMIGYRQALENEILPYLTKNAFGLSIKDQQGRIVSLSEIFVADFDLGFIGRLDLVTSLKHPEYGNTKVVLELKGSRNRKKIDYMQSHIIQAVAYQSTFNRIASAYPDQLELLDGVAMAYIYQDGCGDLVPVLGEELEGYEQQWHNWLNRFYELLKGRKAA